MQRAGGEKKEEPATKRSVPITAEQHGTDVLEKYREECSRLPLSARRAIIIKLP